jgi:hypothetical protein
MAVKIWLQDSSHATAAAISFDLRESVDVWRPTALQKEIAIDLLDIFRAKS